MTIVECQGFVLALFREAIIHMNSTTETLLRRMLGGAMTPCRPQMREARSQKMHFQGTVVKTLPSRAWCMVVPKDLTSSPSVLCGPGVELHDDFFFEGAWDGPFEEPPSTHAAVFGTGALCRRDTVTVYTSIYKKHGVLLVRGRRHLVVSNSLPLLLAVTCQRLTDSHIYSWHYHAAMSLGWRAIVKGLSDFPLSRGTFSLRTHCRLRVTPGGIGLAKHLGPRIPRDVSFRQYEEGLRACVARTLDNARSRARQRASASAIATVSSGYDSTAVAALASRVGCNEGVTIDGGDGDCGLAIGEALGLRMQSVQKTSSLDQTGLATVLAMPGNTGHTPWLALAPWFRNKVVLTGWYGDTAWRLTHACAFRQEFASVVGNAGLPEARLWLDATFVPVIAAGDIDQHHLVALSLGDDMAPFRTMTSYDRPIPRRIATEAGVDHLLATRKLEGSVAKIVNAPAAVDHGINASANRLSLSLSEPLMVRARQQFDLAGWAWNAPVVVDRRLTSLEAIFRWAVDHLTREYQVRLYDAGYSLPLHSD